MAMNRDPNVELNIQELALIGFAQQDGEAIQTAIATELQRLLETEGFPTAPVAGDYPLCTAEPIALSPHQDATAIGTAVAHAIYRGLTA